MEDVKRAAAYHFCKRSGLSPDVVYGEVLSVSGRARRSYYATDGVGDAEFAALMFHDGCFLLQFMLADVQPRMVDPSLLRCFMSNLPSILRDVMLLENQIPWLVVEALIYRPPHLLGLLRDYLSGSMVPPDSAVDRSADVTSFPQSSSAIELAEIGIKLTAGRTTHLRDMGVRKGHLLGGELFLAPLVLDGLNACWLVNMVALEACWPETGIVCSYVFLLAMLVNRAEDVHELRVRRILHGDFSDQHALDFVMSLVRPLCIPDHYARIQQQLEAYKRNRWAWIAVHRFFYGNFKTIVTVLSILGVLVGIFKTPPFPKQD
ncbi:hypothetical protein HU200_023580 [Digitaria exilis]|uniref:Uncharacterized protein n=1 Tax=Digitaria exilis TaxID=1010633 RepID=A0A835CCJ3_9POAL|nr:hypothetical protein HU200_023580 [Digitaria exilis]